MNNTINVNDSAILRVHHELGHHVYMARIGTIYIVVNSNTYNDVARTYKNYLTAEETFETWVEDYTKVPVR